MLLWLVGDSATGFTSPSRHTSCNAAKIFVETLYGRVTLPFTSSHSILLLRQAWGGGIAIPESSHHASFDARQRRSKNHWVSESVAPQGGTGSTQGMAQT